LFASRATKLWLRQVEQRGRNSVTQQGIMPVKRGATVQAMAWSVGIAVVFALLSQALPAFADQPVNGGIDFQPPATDVKADIISFHNMLLVIITAITILVLGLLIWVVLRYNRAANPTPKTFTHNMTVEVIWTAVPVAILALIAVYSFPLLAEEERVFGGAKVDPAEVVTIKAVGNSWFWQHEYQDYGGLQITSNMLPAEEARAAGKPALLATDAPILVPVNTYVRLLVTSNDVIHSWAMPSFGVKEDAIPGRINEGWFKVNKEGVFYGQCSELCGINHAFMPIEIQVVSKEAFEKWVIEQGGQPRVIAAAEAAPAAPAAEAAPIEPAPPAEAAPAAAPAAQPTR
jgi:cytochrome c oxidase subunit II